MKNGDVFVIPPMTMHAYYDTENLEVYHILLHKNFISSNQDESIAMQGFLQLMEIEPFLRSNFSDAMFLHLSQSQLVQLKSDLRYIEEGGAFDREELIPLRHHTMWKILYWFSFLLSEQMNAKETQDPNQYEPYIIHALEYIHKNYGEKITIDRLCRETFLSRSTFLRSFQTICGCTPIRYLSEYRRKKAVEMLENGRLSKTEIAHSCGFYDLSHMERILKKQ